MKELFKNKSLGFYFTIASAVLALITGIVYAVGYHDALVQGIEIISWPVFAVFMVIFAVNLVGIILNKSKFAVMPCAILSSVALCMYVYAMYYYVSVMQYGIDAQYDARFFITTGLVVVLFGISYANVYLKHEKKVEDK